MGYNLQLEQSQKLIMTPQLKQAIQILQFPTIELDQYIQDQIEKNPVLELSNEKEPGRELDKGIEDKKKEVDWKEYIKDMQNHGYSKGYAHSDENEFNYENIISSDVNLQEHLLFQFHVTLLDREYNEIGEYIICNLDENGYLTLSIEEIAKDLRVGINLVEDVLHIIQTFEPPGVAARNLTECLTLQLNSLAIEDQRVYDIVEKYLELMASNKYPVIAKKMKISVNKVQEICDFIRTLEPKPGREFATNESSYVIPDVVVKKIDDEYVIIVNDYSAPRLTIRQDYQKLMTNECENSETVKFLNDKFNAAAWLIKSIEQRRNTIYRVVESIMSKQRSFFEHGKKHLRPMTLKEIAEEIDVHESTVSRATNGKYVETPIGIFELKYFFTSGVGGDVGVEGTSSKTIKAFISEIIQKENPKKPLSDDKIVKELATRAMHLSRRTVAKYRDDLRIPSSSKRKRY
ncbi:RNA polymerase factor sigma-54 [Alkaliphilus metalliredigens]|nr:RNA polymerase factor sigma-54 [Alkaliphilus metalliredigens]